MGFLRALFGKNTKGTSSAQPVISTEKLMTSQLPALYLRENNSTYRENYVNRLESIGFHKADAEKMFDFECNVIRKYPKEYLLHPQFTKL